MVLAQPAAKTAMPVRLGFALLTLLGNAVSMVHAQGNANSEPPRLALEVQPHRLAICRLDAAATLPAWAAASTGFLTVSRTADELSVTAIDSVVPSGVRCERDYRALRVQGPLPLDLIGILAAIADPLARAGLSIFAISTFDTDYVLVKAANFDAALSALERAGHRIIR
jgi:hypothetical protein